MRSVIHKIGLGLALCAHAIVGNSAQADLAFEEVNDETVSLVLRQPSVIREFSGQDKENVRIKRTLPWYGASISESQLITRPSGESPNTAFLLSRGEKVLGVISMLRNHRKWRYNGLYDQPFAERIEKALKVASSDSRVKEGSYEPRLLSIVSAASTAIWLKGKNDNLFIALPETFAPMKAYKVYSEDEFSKILAKIIPTNRRQKYG